MLESTLTRKGQMTLPKPIREALGLQTGDRISFVLEGKGTVRLIPSTMPLTDIKGMFHHPATKKVSIAEMNEAIRRRGGGR